MAKQDDKVHNHIAAGLSDTRVSPAVLALKMLQENVYVNESLLQYFVNYINTMANAKVLPLHLQEVQGQCQALQISLQELGLLGTQGRVQATSNEFLSL
jgi:hypothetical protein